MRYKTSERRGGGSILFDAVKSKIPPSIPRDTGMLSHTRYRGMRVVRDLERRRNSCLIRV